MVTTSRRLLARRSHASMGTERHSHITPHTRGDRRLCENTLVQTHNCFGMDKEKVAYRQVVSYLDDDECGVTCEDEDYDENNT